VPAGLSLAGRQPSMTERFRMARRGKGIPAQGVPVLVGQRWGIPHSPGLLKPAFQAAPPVTAGWWLLATTDFSLCLPRVRDGCAAYKDQQPDARVTPQPASAMGGAARAPHSSTGEHSSGQLQGSFLSQPPLRAFHLVWPSWLLACRTTALT